MNLLFKRTFSEKNSSFIYKVQAFLSIFVPCYGRKTMARQNKKNKTRDNY